MNDLIELFDYHSWCYQYVLEHMQSLPDTAVLHAEFDSGFPSIADLLIHVYNGESFWYSVLNIEYPYHTIDKLETLEEYKAHFNSIQSHIREHLIQRINSLDAMISFTSRKGLAMNNTVREIVLTIVDHGTYHRGNLSIMLRQLGYRSVSRDYAFYLNRKRAAN